MRLLFDILFSCSKALDAQDDVFDGLDGEVETLLWFFYSGLFSGCFPGFLIGLNGVDLKTEVASLLACNEEAKGVDVAGVEARCKRHGHAAEGGAKAAEGYLNILPLSGLCAEFCYVIDAGVVL